MLISSRMTNDEAGDLLTLVYRVEDKEIRSPDGVPLTELSRCGWFLKQKALEDMLTPEIERVSERTSFHIETKLWVVILMYREAGWRRLVRVSPFNPVLGHMPRYFHDPDYPRWECTRCRCWHPSEWSGNPCGDGLGWTVQKIAAVHAGRHVWEYWYRGVLLRRRERE